MTLQLPLLEPAARRPAGLDYGPRSISAVRVLRISITDRCNLRCIYCMPSDGIRWLPKEDLLSADEIVEVARAAIEAHGISRFKITGGEPTVRGDLVELIRRLRRLRGLEDLSLITNGLLLPQLALPLKEAGLDRITISLDSLHPERFRRITRCGDLADVLHGIDRVEQAGFKNLKINCVAMRGTNDDEFPDFALLTIRRRVTVRFIEYMPLGEAAVMHGETATRAASAPADACGDCPEAGPAAGCSAQFRGHDIFISEREVRRRIESRLGPLLPLDRRMESGVGPSIIYRLSRSAPAGKIGFISAMSAPFCDTCNRLRLTADGRLCSCLFDGGEVDIKPILRGPLGSRVRATALADAMTDCVRLKPHLHSGRGYAPMSRIGG